MVENSKKLIFSGKTTSLKCQMKGILKVLLVKFAIMKRVQDSCVKIFGEMIDLHKILICILSNAKERLFVGCKHKICNLDTCTRFLCEAFRLSVTSKRILL